MEKNNILHAKPLASFTNEIQNEAKDLFNCVLCEQKVNKVPREFCIPCREKISDAFMNGIMRKMEEDQPGWSGFKNNLPCLLMLIIYLSLATSIGLLIGLFLNWISK